MHEEQVQGPKHFLLDHGYLQVVDKWGSDEAIIRGARMSTAKGFLGWGETCTECGWSKGDDHEVGCSRPGTYKPGDEKLLAFLWKNKHSTPFEMAGITLEVRAPIMVFREWHRHRVPFGYSEASARYAPLPALDYLPTVERLLEAGPQRNKQATSVDGASTLTNRRAGEWLEQLAAWQREGESLYQFGLRSGVPKELARMAMSVGRFSTMRATGNLRGWLGFCALRCAPGAQKEIRVYADVIHTELSRLFPRTMQVVDAAGY